MGVYLLKRLSLAVPTLLAVSLAAFLLTTAARGDPALIALQQDGSVPTPALLQQERHTLGLDAPLPVRYLRWLGGLARGNLGRSTLQNRPVRDILGERIGATLMLSAVAFVLSTAAGVTLGVLLALSHSRALDVGIRSAAVLLGSVPAFLIAIGAITLFGERLHLLPVAGYGSWKNFILPALALALGPMVLLLRLTRLVILEALGEDFVRTARAKGLPERTIARRHLARNAAIPVLTLSGLRLGQILGGAAIVESIFAWPGMGSVLITAISGRDLPVIAGYVLLIGLPVILVNVLTDVLCHAIDPRLRFSAGRPA